MANTPSKTTQIRSVSLHELISERVNTTSSSIVFRTLFQDQASTDTTASFAAPLGLCGVRWTLSTAPIFGSKRGRAITVLGLTWIEARPAQHDVWDRTQPGTMDLNQFLRSLGSDQRIDPESIRVRPGSMDKFGPSRSTLASWCEPASAHRERATGSGPRPSH